MPRTYRFDHFTAQAQNPSRADKRQQKQALIGSKQQAHGEVESPRISYGRQHGKSAEHYQSLHEKYEELEERHAEDPVISGKAKPIGALPGIEAAELRGGFGEVLDRARKDLQRMKNAVGDFVNAGTHVAKIPADVFRTAIRRFRPA